MSEHRVSPARLIGTLSGFGAIAGFLIVAAFQWAQPRILASRAAVLKAAVQDVLSAPDSTQTLFVYENALTPQPPANADTAKLERIYAGYRGTVVIGYAIIAAAPGFADVITLIYGYDAVGDRVIGMKVLENKETPGLGDRIVKDSAFVAEFSGVGTPLKGVKRGAGTGAKNEVDLITGATISSRTVIAIVNKSLGQMKPMLDVYVKGAVK
jgi:electron transport complex protein RnfG